MFVGAVEKVILFSFCWKNELNDNKLVRFSGKNCVEDVDKTRLMLTSTSVFDGHGLKMYMW